MKPITAEAGARNARGNWQSKPTKKFAKGFHFRCLAWVWNFWPREDLTPSGHPRGLTVGILRLGSDVAIKIRKFLVRLPLSTTALLPCGREREFRNNLEQPFEKPQKAVIEGMLPLLKTADNRPIFHFFSCSKISLPASSLNFLRSFEAYGGRVRSMQGTQGKGRSAGRLWGCTGTRPSSCSTAG